MNTVINIITMYKYKVKSLTVLSIAVLAMSLDCPAQNVEFNKKNFKDDKKMFKEALKELQEGDDYYEVQRFTTALEHYKKAQ